MKWINIKNTKSFLLGKKDKISIHCEELDKFVADKSRHVVPSRVIEYYEQQGSVPYELMERLWVDNKHLYIDLIHIPNDHFKTLRLFKGVVELLAPRFYIDKKLQEQKALQFFKYGPSDIDKQLAEITVDFLNHNDVSDVINLELLERNLFMTTMVVLSHIELDDSIYVHYNVYNRKYYQYFLQLYMSNDTKIKIKYDGLNFVEQIKAASIINDLKKEIQRLEQAITVKQSGQRSFE